ncbi:MAG: hypothetical protein ABSF98_14155 [Bryobacteraceae bacterium]
MFQGATAGPLGGRGIALQGADGVGIGGAGRADHLLNHDRLEAANAGGPPAGLTISSTRKRSCVVVGAKAR